MQQLLCQYQEQHGQRINRLLHTRSAHEEIFIPSLKGNTESRRLTAQEPKTHLFQRLIFLSICRQLESLIKFKHIERCS